VRAGLKLPPGMDEQQERWTGGGCPTYAYASARGRSHADQANWPRVGDARRFPFSVGS
jgi:hypothetical protein